jgi:putative resolvase
MSDVNLTEWARLQGIRPQAACRWLREGMLPVSAVRVSSRSVLVAPDTVIAAAGGDHRIGRYARVSCPGRRVGPGRQVARLRCAAGDVGPASCRVVR